MFDDEPLIDIKAAFLNYQFQVLGIEEFLNDPDVTEISINKPGEVYIERASGWHRIPVEALTFDRARQFCTAILNASNTGQSITNSHPLVSFTFPTGQRAQFVMPPACEPGSISITIRVPNKHSFTLEQYKETGFFSRLAENLPSISPQDLELIALKNSGNYAEFFSKAVQHHKNIVVAGATGSGKTTFMKSLVTHISPQERLVTIEDARELFLTQPNAVHLLYSKGGQSIAKVSAKDCMEACLRMKPDRILLAELRGDEAFFFIRNCASGHPGSITSCHAGSVGQAWEQLALMIKASPEGAGLEYDVIKHLLRLTVDVMVHIHSAGGKRVITGVEFVPENRAATIRGDLS
jgi:type IV secretion system protein VirB11